jgi:AcrR family transcriptional regulator
MSGNGHSFLAQTMGPAKVSPILGTIYAIFRRLLSLGVLAVKQRAKTVQEMSFQFEKPAKQRIIEAADKMFRLFGIHASLGAIAHQAHSNVDTIQKYFRYHQRLLAIFIKSQIEGSEKIWQDLEGNYPNDPEGCLRFWISMESDDDLFRPAAVLSRSAAELPRFPKDPLLDQIEQYWQAERRRVVRLCDAAGFREPRDLADKLLLLVHGSRNERQAYGHHAPSRMLSQAGDDLMVVHGAARKPPLFG